MTIEYVDLKKDMTVEDAFSRIRATGVDKETIYTCYVTNQDRKLEGLVTVRELLLSPKNGGHWRYHADPRHCRLYSGR